MQKQLDKRLVIGIAVVVVAVLAIIIAVANYKPTIKLNDYVKVTFSGYDTVGEAEVVFDIESFCNDYEGKLKDLEMSQITGPELLAKRADGNLDKTSRLSNGDEIVYRWDFDASAVENVFDCKIECSDITFTVEGLEELETFDAFAEVEVVCEGIAPYGTVSLTNKATEEYAKNLSFTYDASSLKNGDSFTVELDFSEDFGSVNGYVEVYGKMPESLEKEYVVEGLPEYITTIEQLSDDVTSSLKQQAEVAHANHVAKEWKNGEYGSKANVTDFEYLGAYVLASNERSMFNRACNKVLMVYKVSAHAENEFENLHLSGDTTYYTAIIFDNVYVDSDGVLTVSEAGAVVQSSNHELKLQHDTSTWHSVTFYFYGYTTLEDLVRNEIDSRLDAYTYETNIKGE